MSGALLHAEAANDKALRLKLTIQQLIDAFGAGCTITLFDLHVLRTDCSDVCYAVGRTFSAISKEPQHRRMEESQ